MLKVITTSLEVLSSATIKFDVLITTVPESSYQQKVSLAQQSQT